MNHAYRRIPHEVRSKKMASLCEDHSSRILLSYRSVILKMVLFLPRVHVHFSVHERGSHASDDSYGNSAVGTCTSTGTYFFPVVNICKH